MLNQSRAARVRHGESEERDLHALVADAAERQALVAVRDHRRRGLKVGALADPGHLHAPSRAATIRAFLAGFGLRTGDDYLDRNDGRPTLRAVRTGAARLRRTMLSRE